MMRPTPRSTRTATLFPYTTLVRSKRGDSYLRTLLIQGARSMIYAAQRKEISDSWLSRLLKRRNANVAAVALANKNARIRSEEHTSELQSLMRISYAVFCLKKKLR